MAEQYITNPFIVKLKNNTELVDYPNFNGKYVVAVQFSPCQYIYYTLETYKKIPNKDIFDIFNNEEYIVGTDYMCSMSMKPHIVNLITEDLIVSSYQNNTDDCKIVLYNNKIYMITTSEDTTLTIQQVKIYISSLLENNEKLSFKLVFGDSECDNITDIELWFETIGNDILKEYKLYITLDNGYDLTVIYDFELCSEYPTVSDNCVTPIQYTIKNVFLPNLIENYQLNTNYFEEDIYQETTIDLYAELNKRNNKFSDEELASLCSTFCNEILNLTNIQEPLSSQDIIYKKVLEFYRNEGTDETSEFLQLLGALFTSTNNTSVCCSSNSCSSSLSNAYGLQQTIQSCDCVQQYKDYLLSTLSTMLGNVDFYKNWFNSYMCDDLIRLLNEFKQQDYNLVFNKNSQFSCPSITNNENECNYTSIDNYIKVLEWVKDNEITTNTNKIKAYGQTFGELLPNLLF